MIPINFITKKILVVLMFLLFLSSCSMLFKTHFMESVNFGELKDGIYTGEDKVLFCSVKLRVEIKENKIANIKILNKFSTWPLAPVAYGKIPQRIIEEQSLDVDAVTMATVSSNNVKKAVLDALNKARK